MPDFTYTPLKDSLRNIRLLTCLPTQHDDFLRLATSLEEVVPSEEVSSHLGAYVALSYTWGPSTPVHPIIVDGQILEIRRNLWLLLHQLSKEQDTRKLWADAVCINQKNCAEKDAQVSIMGLIFSQAAEVIIWMGEAFENTASFFSFIKTHSWRQLNDLHFRSDSNTDPRILAVNDEIDLHLEAFRRLCNQSYWERTWIIQEIHLARGYRSIRCGEQTIGFTRFVEMFKYVEKHLQNRMRPLCNSFGVFCAPDFEKFLMAKVIAEIPRRGYGEIASDVLPYFIRHYGELQCTDSRDRVYALLGLVKNRTPDSPQLQIDYSKNASELFWRTVAFCTSNDVYFTNDLLKALELDIDDIKSCSSSNNISNARNGVPMAVLRPLGVVKSIQPMKIDGCLIHLFSIANAPDGRPKQGIAFGDVRINDEVFISPRGTWFSWVLTAESRDTDGRPWGSTDPNAMCKMSPTCLGYLKYGSWKKITRAWVVTAFRKAQEAHDSFQKLQITSDFGCNTTTPSAEPKSCLSLDRAAILFMEQFDSTDFWSGHYELWSRNPYRHLVRDG